ncbi:hypothetical protein KSP40_PGU000117 [Platanthera guangdongensis]|uniref:Uncharacterized protein n=1 Tax=Platanthera guangdongensis TaxID=2320717 RepID=A0ABR2MIV6_9ASPA
MELVMQKRKNGFGLAAFHITLSFCGACVVSARPLIMLEALALPTRQQLVDMAGGYDNNQKACKYASPLWNSSKFKMTILTSL